MKPKTSAMFFLDLTKQAPRGPRVRLGGFVILPRLLDKGRATIAGKNGEYCFNCPLDQRFFSFAGINAAALKKKLTTGASDSEMLAWIMTKSASQPSVLEIAAWSTTEEQRVPAATEPRALFNKFHGRSAPEREDIATWFDLLDVDDYVSFGGKP